MMSRKYEMNMTEGPMLKKMFLFAFPIMLSSALQLLFNAVDTIVVGRFVGNTALAAVGSTGALVNLIVGLFMGLGVGTNVLTAQGYGAGREKDVGPVVHTSVAISLLFGTFLGIFGYFFASRFLGMMNTPGEVIGEASLYLRIYFIGMPFIMLYNFASAVLRAVGDSRRPMYFLVIAGVVNLVMNLFFVLVVGIGVAGVAIATVLSNVMASLLVVRCLVKADGMIHLDLRKLKIDGKVMLKILKIGLPAGIQGVVFSLSNVIIQSSINSFGPLAVAGNTAGSNLESFASMGMNAFYQTNINFTSQNAGAKKYDRVLRCMWLCLAMVAVIGSIMGVGTYLLGGVLLKLYTVDPEVIRYGLIRLSISSTFHFIGGMMDCMVGSLRGLGTSVLPMIVSLTGACGIRILYIYTYFQKHHTLQVLYASYPITWTITFLGHVVCFIIVFRKTLKREEQYRLLRPHLYKKH